MTGGSDYYSKTLSGDRLRRCYAVAPPRVRQYLNAEIEFAISALTPTDEVLELGCGYGRVMFELAGVARRVVGIDTALESLALGRELAGVESRCEFLRMDASRLTFRDASFDAIVCVQNGICAFQVEPAGLVREALRVARPGGRVLMSTYAESFWPHRLEWFEAQAQAGLIGELDREKCERGTIVCRDGLRLGALTPAELRDVGSAIGMEPRIVEVDGSSVFGVWTAQDRKYQNTG